MLRFKSLVGIFENHNWLRWTLQSLSENQYPFRVMTEAFQEVEAFEMLEIMVNDNKNADDEFMIWFCKDESQKIKFTVVDIKLEYSYSQVEAISAHTGIPMKTFKEVAANVSDY